MKKLYTILVFLTFLSYSNSKAASYVWTNFGGDNLWSNPSNWDVDGFGEDGTIPNTNQSDDVYFDAGYSNDNCTIDQSTTIGSNKLISFTIVSGYTGTVSINAGFTFETTGAVSIQDGVFTLGATAPIFGGTFSQSGGTFNGGSGATTTFPSTFTLSGGTFNKTSAAMTINGQFNLSGGTFNSTSGGLNLFNNFNQTGGSFNSTTTGVTALSTTTTNSSLFFTSSAGTFTHSAGTFRFIAATSSPASSNTITINNTPTFNTLLFGNTATGATCDLIIVVSNNITANGNFTVTTAMGSGTRSITINTGVINARANLITTGTSLSTGGGGSGTIILNGTGAQLIDQTGTIGEGIMPLCNVGINSDIARTVTISTSEFLNVGTSASPRTFTIGGSGNITLNGGTVSAFGNVDINNTGAMAGTAQLKITGTATQTFTGTATAGQGILTNVNINKSGGSLNLASIISIAGTWTNAAGTINPGSSTVAFSGTSSITGTNSFNNLTVSSGTLTGSAGTTGVSGNWVNNGTYTHNSGTINFNGNSTLSGTGTHSFNNVSIAGTLSGISAGNFNVAGNFTNNGTFTHNSGTVTFNGSAGQSISGSAIKTAFYDLTVSTTGTTTAEMNCDVISTFTLTDGSLFDADGSAGDKIFTLKSDATQTGKIADLGTTPTNFSGNITMERYVSGNTDWRFLTSPVTGQTLSNWIDDFGMTGFPNSTDPAFSFVSIYTYENGATYTAPADISDPISWNATGGKGFWAYVGNSWAGEPMTPITIDVTGAPITGQQTASLSVAGDMLNLIGNPYPAPIVFNNLTRNNVLLNYWIYDPASGNYLDWNGTTGTASGTIASSQAFWVEASAAGASITFDENDKATAADNFFIRSLNPALTNQFNIKLTGTATTYSDEAILVFNSDASNAFIRTEDTPKRFSDTPQAPSLASLSQDNEVLSINSYSDLTNNLSIPLYVKVGISGNYTLSFPSFNNMPTSPCLVLEDTETGIQTDLRTNSSYSFTMASNATNPNRFIIHISNSIVADVQTISPTCANAADAVMIATPAGSGPWDYTWINTNNGDTVRTISNSLTADTLSQITSGNYSVIISKAGSCGNAVETIIVSQPDAINANAVVSNISCAGNADGSIITTPSGGTGTLSYSWNTGETTSDLSGLSAGTYDLTITDLNGCTTISSVTITEPATIEAASTVNNVSCYGNNDGAVTVTTSGGTGTYSYSWNNGITTSDLSDVTPGTYWITITDANGCTYITSATINQPELLQAASTVDNVSCYGSNDGSVVISTIGGTTPYAYSWNDGTVTSDLNGVAAGTYSLTVTDGNGCTYVTTASIVEPAELIADFSADADTLFLPVDDTIKFTNASFGADSYLWNFGDAGQSTSTDPNPNFNYSAPGDYTVTLTIFNNNNNCTDIFTKTVTVMMATSIADKGSDNFNLDNNSMVNVSIYNLLGQNILQDEQFNIKTGKRKITLPKVPNAAYIISVRTENLSVRKTIILLD